MSSDTVVIFNPAARGDKAKRHIDEIRRLAGEAELVPTSEPDHALRFARRAVADGCRTVVAAGGDGTINQVVNGLAGSDARLGILPVGTMNVFASELGIPGGNVGEAWRIIQRGRVRTIDLPQAGARYFAQMAGIGLDAQIVQETDLDFRKAFGPLSYLMTASYIASRTPPEIRIQGECGRETSGSFVLVGNGRYYGGPFTLFNNARLDDRQLDVLIFKNLGYLDIVRYLQAVITGSHTTMPDVDYFQTSGLTASSGEEIPVEVDGELAGSLPLGFRIERTLSVLAP